MEAGGYLVGVLGMVANDYCVNRPEEKFPESLVFIDTG